MLSNEKMLVAGVISGALLYIKDEFEVVNQSSFLQVKTIFSEVFLLKIYFVLLHFGSSKE